MADEIWDADSGIPMDGVLSDALEDTDGVYSMVDDTLVSLPVDATTDLSAEIDATLAFVNDGGADVADLIDTAISGEELTAEQVDDAQQIIDSGANLPFWEVIEHGNDVSNDIRQDAQERLWREDLLRRETDLSIEVEQGEDVVEDAEHELRWGW